MFNMRNTEKSDFSETELIYRESSWLSKQLAFLKRFRKSTSKKLKLLASVAFLGLLVAGLQTIPAIKPYAEQAMGNIKWKLLDKRQDGEILILIAPFEYIGTAIDNKDHRAIKEAIQNKINPILKEKVKIRIDFLPAPIEEGQTPQEIYQQVKNKNPSILIWGQVASNRTRFSLIDNLIVDNGDAYSANRKVEVVDLDGKYLLPSSVSLSLPRTIDAINFITLWSAAAILHNDQHLDEAAASALRALAIIVPSLDSQNLVGAEADGVYMIFSVLDKMQEFAANGSDTIFTPEFIKEFEKATSKRTPLLQYELTRRLWSYRTTSRDEKAIALKKITNLEDQFATQPSLIRATYYFQRSLMRDEIVLGSGDDDRRRSLDLWKAVPNENGYKFFMLGQLYEISRDYTKCVKTLSEGKNSPESKNWTDMQFWDVEMKIAQCKKNNNDRSAISHLDEAMKYAKHKKLKSHVITVKANYLESFGKAKEAIDLLEAHIQDDPTRTWDWHNLAYNHLIIKNYSRARELELAVLQNGGHFANAYRVLWAANLGLDRTIEEIKEDFAFLDLAQKVMPDDSEMLALRLSINALHQTRSNSSAVNLDIPSDAPIASTRATLEAYAWSVYNTYGSRFAIRYIDRLSSQGEPMDFLNNVAGFACSGEAQLAFTEGRVIDGMSWLECTRKYNAIATSIFPVDDFNARYDFSSSYRRTSGYFEIVKSVRPLIVASREFQLAPTHPLK